MPTVATHKQQQHGELFTYTLAGTVGIGVCLLCDKPLGDEGKERWGGGYGTYHPLYGNGRVEVELSSAEEVQTTATTTEGMTGVCLKRKSASEDAPMNANGQRVLMMAKPAK